MGSEEGSWEAWDKSQKPLSLTEDVRPALIRQEESIIFAMIERSQFHLNPSCYLSGDKSILPQRLDYAPDNPEISLMDYFLLETERFHARLGRYNNAEEHAFNSMISENISLRTQGESRIKPNRININDKIKHVYVNTILPAMCAEGDGVDLGSSCTCDVAVLQAFSRRIHYGKFVAEAKFLAEKEKFSKLIRNNDAQGLMDALTHPVVEEKVIERVRNKASHYGTDGTEQAVYKVQPDVIAKLYKEVLIPLNKQVQVQYLLQRLDRPTFAYSACSENCLKAGEIHFGSSQNSHKCATITDVFKAVASNMVPFGVVPIENPGSGLLKEALTCFLESTLKVSASIQIPVKEGAAFERYFVIGPILPTLTDQVSHFIVMFTTMHEPGSLLKALNSIGDLNICYLESVPSSKANEYFFYCEVESPSEASTAQKALERLQGVTSQVKTVGFIFLT